MFWSSFKEEGMGGHHDRIIPIYNKEWCLRCGSNTKDKPVVSSKWIFKTKHSANGSIEKFKARFVAWGFSQKQGIDCEEAFTPVARYTYIKTILDLAAKMKWNLHQMYVKT